MSPKSRIVVDVRCGCQTLVNRDGFVLLSETCPICMVDGLVRLAIALGWNGDDSEEPDLFSAVKPESESDPPRQS